MYMLSILDILSSHKLSLQVSYPSKVFRGFPTLQVKQQIPFTLQQACHTDNNNNNDDDFYTNI